MRFEVSNQLIMHHETRDKCKSYDGLEFGNRSRKHIKLFNI